MMNRKKAASFLAVLSLFLLSFTHLPPSRSAYDDANGLPRPALDAQCVVPSSSYEVSFDDFSENKGKIAWTCQTKTLRAANHTSDPIRVYLLMYTHNLNESGTAWHNPISLQAGETKEIDSLFYSGKGGTEKSLPEYHLPVQMAALYDTEACRADQVPGKLPAFALEKTVPLTHPCPGPEGVDFSGGVSAGNEPAAQPPETEVEKPEEVPPEPDPDEYQDPLLTGLMYILFTEGDLRGFEETKEGQALSTEERARIAEFLSSLELLTHYGDTFIYPNNHDCVGYTSRADCEKHLQSLADDRKIEREKERLLEQAIDQATEEYMRRQRINRIVQEEIAGRGRWLFYTEDLIQYLRKPPSPREYVKGEIDTYIKSKFTPEDLQNIELTSYEDVLRGGISAVIQMSTCRAPDHYNDYLVFYHKHLQTGASPGDAHLKAIEELEAQIIDGFPGAAAYIKAYDRAFIRLNRLYEGAK